MTEKQELASRIGGRLKELRKQSGLTLKQLGEEKFILKKGDALYLNGSVPHKAISLSKRPARSLSINLIPGSRTGFFESEIEGS